MALVRDEYWLKLAGRKKSREKRERREIMEGRKSEDMGFKARKRMITRNRDCSARVGRSRADGCDGVVCVRSKES